MDATAMQLNIATGKTTPNLPTPEEPSQITLNMIPPVGDEISPYEINSSTESVGIKITAKLIKTQIPTLQRKPNQNRHVSQKTRA